jgi:hypothetical protein
MFIIPGIQNITPLGYPNQRALAANTNENHQTPKTGGKKTGKKNKCNPFSIAMFNCQRVHGLLLTNHG